VGVSPAISGILPRKISSDVSRETRDTAAGTATLPEIEI
jgi:hypothetical protein